MILCTCKRLKVLLFLKMKAKQNLRIRELQPSFCCHLTDTSALNAYEIYRCRLFTFVFIKRTYQNGQDILRIYHVFTAGSKKCKKFTGNPILWQ